MKKVILTSCIVLYLSSAGISQNLINGRLLYTFVDGNTYTVKLQINSNSHGNHLGSSNFRFNYEGDISFSNNPIPGVDYKFYNFSENNYQVSYLTSPSSGEISVNIELNSPNNGTYIAVSPDWTDVVELCFNIENPAGFANLKWTPSATVVFSDDENNLFEKGIMSDLTYPSSTTNIAEGIPKNFALDQNFPNPFNPTTTIRFALPISAYANLKLYNTLGQEVAIILDTELDAGIHEITYNAPFFSSGVYFYRMEVTGSDRLDFVSTKRMLLLK